MTPDELGAAVAAGEVHDVLLALPDLMGRLQGTRVGARHFLDAVLDGGFGACTYLLTTDLDMNVVAPAPELDPEGTGYGDMLLSPDHATLRPLPWDPGTVMVIADARHPDGRPVSVSPRQALREQIQALATHGLTPYAGFELEFRVFEEDYSTAAHRYWHGLTPTTRSTVDYALTGLGALEPFARRLRRDMAVAGLEVESARGECAPGQYEIVFRYDEAMACADVAAFYKNGVKQIAAQEGLAATFMAKFDRHEGNSCHFHVSLRDEEDRAVFRGDGSWGESELLRHALAGQLKLLPELMLLFAPTVNAYKRLRPGAFAPLHAAWGPDNRLTALRLAGAGESLRVEHRVPGADADPYVALAGILLAFRHGIEHRPGLPSPSAGAPPEDAPHLPATLAEAADLLDGSEAARRGLGDALVDSLVAAARAEWEAFLDAVTDWERARGFERR